MTSGYPGQVTGGSNMRACCWQTSATSLFSHPERNRRAHASHVGMQLGTHVAKLLGCPPAPPAVPGVDASWAVSMGRDREAVSALLGISPAGDCSALVGDRGLQGAGSQHGRPD